jgi:hypothetical protein
MAEALAVILAVMSPPQDVQLTVYNQNFALVREVRTVELKQGDNFVKVEDIPAHIEPTSIHFVSKTAPNAVVIREQNYQYDLLNPVSIVNKSVGQPVAVRYHTRDRTETISGTLLNPATLAVPQTGSRQPRRYGGWSSQTFAGSGISTSGTPISLNPNVLAIETDQGIIVNPQGELVIAQRPEGLISKPLLNWKVACTKAGKHEAELSYITSMVNWQADYVAVANEDDTQVDLSGWVTLENHAGTGFAEAGLQLMAGDVRRIQPDQRGDYAYAGARMAMEAPGGPGPQFEEQPFFEYHLYTMTDKTTIANNETKQLSLLTANEVPVNKIYLFDAQRAWWWRWTYGRIRRDRPGEGRDTSEQTKVHVMLELKNSEQNNMGMPLPKGAVKVYKADDKQRLQFIGEDEIDHTPRDEKLRLWVGDAFDVVGEHKRTNYTKISDHVTEEEFEISLRNHKDTDITVTVVERVPGDWQVLDKTHEFRKKDAHTIEFDVPVAADREAKLNYRVRIRW